MPHVDDGTLHALLDGALRADEPERADAVEAHLAGCPACRARRDAAAELLGRASGILAAIEPDIRPDFDEVLVRAGARETAHAEPEPRADGAVRGSSLRRQARWTRRLAWAATIVIALGTGYLIRDRVVPGRVDQEAEAATDMMDRSAPDSMPETAAAAQPASQSGEQTPSPEPEVSRDAARDGSLAADGANGNLADVDVAGADSADTDAVEFEEQARVAGAAGLMANESVRASRSVRETEARRAVEPEATPAPRPAAVAANRSAEETRATSVLAGTALRDTQALALSDTQALALQEIVVTGVAARRARETGDRAGGWVDVDESRASALLRGPLYRLQVGEPIRIETREVGDSLAVRTTQRLPQGLEIRLVQRPLSVPTANADAAEPAGAPVRGQPLQSAEMARTIEPVPLRLLARDRVMEFTASGLEVDLATVRLVRDDYELVLTGRLPPDLLRLLGATAEPVPR